MNITKTLTLAAVAALSLGIGSAMAQEGGESGYNSAPVQHVAPIVNGVQVQSGSSDVDTYAVPRGPNGQPLVRAEGGY